MSTTQSSYPTSHLVNIPSEIKTLIFYHCCNPLFDIALVHHVLGIIQSVSKEWRQIVLDSPMLWSSFTLPAVDVHRRMLVMLQRSLARSKSCPLQFEIVGNLRPSFTDMECVYSILDALSAQAKRWERVHFEMDEQLSNRLFKNNSVAGALALQQFNINLDLLYSQNRPQAVQMLDIPLIPWNRLTGVESSFALTAPLFLRLLMQCPQLRYLKMPVRLTPKDPALVTSYPTTLGRSLRALCLVLSCMPETAEDTRKYFDWFFLQLEDGLQLEKLTLSWPHQTISSPLDCGMLVDFVRSQGTILQYLELDGFPVNEQMIDCLRALPQLQELRILSHRSSKSSSKPFFHFLMSKDCPLRLKTLEIHGFPPTYRAESILEFLQAMSLRPGLVKKFIFKTIQLRSEAGEDIDLSGCQPYLHVWKDRGLEVDLRAHGWTENASYRHSNYL